MLTHHYLNRKKAIKKKQQGRHRAGVLCCPGRPQKAQPIPCWNTLNAQMPEATPRTPPLLGHVQEVGMGNAEGQSLKQQGRS
eukprot:1160477-Pelagomonas_calceolata.AAC.12